MGAHGTIDGPVFRSARTNRAYPVRVRAGDPLLRCAFCRREVDALAVEREGRCPRCNTML